MGEAWNRHTVPTLKSRLGNRVDTACLRNDHDVLKDSCVVGMDGVQRFGNPPSNAATLAFCGLTPPVLPALSLSPASAEEGSSGS